MGKAHSINILKFQIMKKKVFMMLPCIAAVAIAAFVGKKSLGTHAYETNSLLLQNVEALSSNADNGGTGNTGPRQKYDCPWIGTGDGFNCACTNPYDCTPQDC